MLNLEYQGDYCCWNLEFGILNLESGILNLAFWHFES
jgi:hypothetical protein